MFAFLLAPFLLALAPLTSGTDGGCRGADPAILHAGVRSMTANGDLNHYTIDITVRNVGQAGQPSNLLQSIEVSQDATPVDRIGLQPLKPGATQTVSYAFDRSKDAGTNTTRLTFRLVQKGMTVPGPLDCNVANDIFRLTL